MCEPVSDHVTIPARSSSPMVARMISDPDPDIDPDAKRIVEKHGAVVINNAAIDAALRADRARAAGDAEEAAFWRRAADGLDELLQAAQVPRQPGH